MVRLAEKGTAVVWQLVEAVHPLVLQFAVMKVHLIGNICTVYSNSSNNTVNNPVTDSVGDSSEDDGHNYMTDFDGAFL